MPLYLFEFDPVFDGVAGAGVFAAGRFAAGVGLALFPEEFAVLFDVAVFAALPVFETLAAAFVFVVEFVFAPAGIAGRAPLNSFGLFTTFFARKFSIFASFIAIAWYDAASSCLRELIR